MARRKSAVLESFQDIDFRNGKDIVAYIDNSRDKDAFHVKSLKWTEKQKRFIDICLNPETKIVFVEGPAGSSKTLLSVYSGLRMLSAGDVKELTYIRSAVESADSRLGFLPGDAEDKLHFFNLPFMDKLNELVSEEQIKKLQKSQRVSTYPVNFSRGMSWNDRCIVLDECQNSTFKEIVTVLTRIGENTKIFLCADNKQTDLRNGNRGGFEKLHNLFTGEDSEKKGIHSFQFDHNDIMRSEILKYIIKKIDTLEL
tara:strand:- start:224 stop:988 length:765 start_codon:yes stop_codon:yes gene_type:complete